MIPANDLLEWLDAKPFAPFRLFLSDGRTFDIRDPNWDPEAGVRALSDIIQSKPDVLVVHNLDVQSYARTLKQAQDAGIKVVQVNMESVYQTESFVGAAWAEVGRKEAELVVNHCKGKSGKVAIIAGAPTAAASLYTIGGAYEVLKADPNIKVVSDQAANWDPSKARAIMETVLQQNPDLCGVIDMWDSQGVGAGAVIKEAGKSDQVFLSTNGGGSMPGCENIQKGLLSAIVSYDVPTQGELLNAEILRQLTNKAADGNHVRIYSPLRVIDKTSATPRNCWKLDDLH